MLSSWKRRKWRLILAGFVGVFVLVKVVDWLIWLRLPPDIREYSLVRADWDSTRKPINQAKKEDFARRCLEIARRYPGTVGGLSALMAAATSPDSSAGREAQQAFARQLETADVGMLAQAFEWSMGGWETLEPFAPAILSRARQSLDHPRAGRLLAAVCTITEPQTRDGPEPSPLYTEAADLIADRCALSPEIGHFCEGLGFLSHGTQRWAPRFERHLRAILKVNRDRSVRCRAQFALASVVQNAPEDRQAEAETLFEQYCTEFDGKYVYSFQGIEKTLNDLAQTQLKELRFRAVGRPAPDISGLDLDGRPLKLSDYRGRVVLLNFWGTWCFPCMKLIPHERELVARFQGEPFEIVGVNCDQRRGQSARRRLADGYDMAFIPRSHRGEAGGDHQRLEGDRLSHAVLDRSSRNHPQAVDRRSNPRRAHAHDRGPDRRGPAQDRAGSDARGRVGFASPCRAKGHRRPTSSRQPVHAQHRLSRQGLSRGGRL